MAAKLEEIVAKLIRVYRPKPAEDGRYWGIFTIRPEGKEGDVTATGYADVEGSFALHEGVDYRFYGSWGMYKAKNLPQFELQDFVVAEQLSREGIIGYLHAAGSSHGLTRNRAMLLYERFNGRAIKVLRETPEVAAAALDGMKPSRSMPIESLFAVAARLRFDAGIESSLIELSGLLAKTGMPRNLPRQLLRDMGTSAAQRIKADPFILMARKYRGCGFKRCDKLYNDLGCSPNKLRRQMFAAYHKIREDGNGSTWLPASFAHDGIKKNIGGTDPKPDLAVQLGIRSGWLSMIHTDGPTGPIVPGGRTPWVSLRNHADAEAYVAKRIVELASCATQWPSVSLMKHGSDHQREQLARALQCPFATLIGGPGTGKSFTTSAYIETLVSTFGEENVRAAAPTNKAGVRLTNQLREYGLDLQATSFHRLLGVKKASSGGQWSFIHDETKPLRCKVLLLDEASMDSVGIFASILRACLPGVHILLIGDSMQLPPIDHGAVLRDVIAAGLPFGELTEPQRNAGDIVFACDDIRRGKPFRQSEKINIQSVPPANFKFIEANSPEEQIECMLKYLDTCQRNGFDPVWDCQVMVAVNEKSDVSRIKLNAILQQHFNAGGSGPRGAEFKVGDKVVCKQNGFYKQYGDSKATEVFVAKGEFGRVEYSQENGLGVRYESRDEVVAVKVFPKSAKADSDEPAEVADEESIEGDNSTGAVQLAYAATAHSMQGSECKIALPIIDGSAAGRRLGTKEHFFTEISRGKLITRPIGQVELARQFCRKSSLAGRKTLLKERILLERANLELAEL